MDTFDVNNMNEDTLKALDNNQIIHLVLSLKEENEKLKNSVDLTVAKSYDDRLEKLEREINLTKQYTRRDTIEITGIPVPENLADDEVDDVEADVLNVLKAAKAKVGPKHAAALDIQAAHRKGKKGVVIVKFVNRKFAMSALQNSKNLKDTKIFGENHRVFINSSLCPEFAYLHYAVRQAKKNGEINFYSQWNGLMKVKMTKEGKPEEISHVNDLSRLGITVPDRRF